MFYALFISTGTHENNMMNTRTLSIFLYFVKTLALNMVKLMASSSEEEEGEIVPDCVDKYHILDNKDNPVSLHILPIQWSIEKPTDSEMQVLLHGCVDNGLQKICMRVIAWKFELLHENPEMFVLTKECVWIKLQNPRKCFKNVIRGVVVAVYWLHCVKHYPNASSTFMWSHLQRMLSFGHGKPCENDLLDHVSLFKDAARHDMDLAKSKNLLSFLEKPNINCSVVEDHLATNEVKFESFQGDENCDKEECDESWDQPFDTVCVICDDGGEVLPCEGRCMRSFHATPDAVGSDSLCASLGYTRAEVDAITSFVCPNCKLQLHQCYACGQLGSSKRSIGAEVFPCVAATCGHFYHPLCVSSLIHPNDENQAHQLIQKIIAGESFTCPVHKCSACKQGEDKDDKDLQFALCRRCPKAYHRKCLPREIACQGSGPQRAWYDLLPNRILIYCMDHPILSDLLKPERNHVKFPRVGKKKHDVQMLLKKEKFTAEYRDRVFENQSVERNGEKLLKQVHYVHNDVRIAEHSKGVQKRSSGQDGQSLKRTRIFDTDGKHKLGNDKAYMDIINKPVKIGKSLLSTDCSAHKINLKRGVSSGKTKKIISNKPMIDMEDESEPELDADTKKRLLGLMKKCETSFNHEEFMKRQGVPATLPNHSNNMLEKTVTLGIVEHSVKAMRTALEKLETDGNLEEAKAICGPGVLKEVLNWRRKLSVYLAPFHHGMRYTSFGRHFTKVDKLNAVVDRLHSYVQNGDTIVDFCCGANDFSCLMKQKLEISGKICSFRNFDIIQPKNDFAFEKRDWMSVGLEELPDGSQLIMGLNPPFGFNASLANKFIDKALEFRPKLLVLIVPEETMRLDRKITPYNLVWEDKELLSGKSFYLPGSVDVHGKHLDQWNNRPPPLYLWSRQDWTSRHRAIVQQCHHVIYEQDQHTMKAETKSEHLNYLMEDNYDCYCDYSSQLGDISSLLDDIPEISDHEADKNEASQNEFMNKDEESFRAENHSEDDMEESGIPATPGWSSELSSDE